MLMIGFLFLIALPVLSDSQHMMYTAKNDMVLADDNVVNSKQKGNQKYLINSNSL